MEWLKALASWITGGSSKLYLRADPRLSSEINKSNRNRKNRSKKKFTFKNSGDVNIIYIEGNPSDDDINELKKKLLPEFKKSNIAFIEEESVELLASYNRFQENPEVAETLDFFKPLLSSLDYRILETGLYIGHKVQLGQNASNIKSNVVNAYGYRGKNIVNLASAGYFKTYLMPLYERLKGQEEDAKKHFTEEYEKIVEDLPFTIFVHHGQTQNEILKEIERRVKTGTKYAQNENRIALHGYSSNAELIESMQKKLTKKFKKVEMNTNFKGELKTTKLVIYYK